MLTVLDGALVLGETSITYFDDVSNESMCRPLQEATIFATWEQIDAQRWLIADDYGKLYLFMLLLRNEDEVQGWKLDMIGETSRASVLIYLDGGYVFLGSHQGDSQLIQIREKTIEVIQTFSNIAPILDFTIMDMGSRTGEGQTNEYSSGQARIVTGSGAFNDGSLRSVRSGVGLEDLGVLAEMEHISDIFALRSSGTAEQVDTLIVSFVDETRVFRFSAEGEVEEVNEYKAFSLSEGTLLALNVSNDRVIQVTRSAVRLIDWESEMVVSEWAPADEQAITAVSANEHNVVLSIGGISLVVLRIGSDLQETARKVFRAETQISCVTIPASTSEICIVGFWQSAAVSIYGLNTLEAIQTEVVGERGFAVPRNVLLAQLLPEQPPTLFVAMVDGNVITFSVDTEDYSLSGRKSIVLGTQQANFKALPRSDGLFNVFATCEHPSLIYGSEGRIVYSAVTAENALCVCPFDAEAYPGSIAIATAKDLRIALVDTERTTHVQTLPLNETVRRVAYSTKLKAFGLGTIKRTLEEGAEVIQSHFKLADEVLFKELDTFALNQDELVESVIRADLEEGPGNIVERFIVGTAYLDDDRDESIRGRILVFEVTPERGLSLVTQIAVKGACRAVGIVAGNVVAALVKTVEHYSTPPHRRDNLY